MKQDSDPTWMTKTKLARIVVGLGILIGILRFVDLPQFAQTLLSLSPIYLVIMLLTAMVGRFLRAWKWNVLLRARGVQISNWQALRMSLVSHFTGAWTPGQIGGDAYRIYALREYGKSNVVLSTVLLERYAGLCAVCLFVLIGLPVTLPFLLMQSPWLVAFLVGVIAVVAVVVPCMFSRRALNLLIGTVPKLKGSAIESKIAAFYETMLEYRNHRGAVFLFSTIALIEVLSYFVLNFFSAKALGLDVSLPFFLFAMPIVHLLLRIPISVQGLGIQEGCFVAALVMAGCTPAQGLAVSVVQRALEWIVAIAPGGLLLWLTPGPSPYEAMRRSE